MSSTLSPQESPTGDALCLQDVPTTTDLAVANSRSFPDAVRAACLKFCEGRPDLLAHAVWSPAAGEILEPLGVLFGEEAITHGELAGGLFRLIAGEGETTPITAPGTGRFPTDKESEIVRLKRELERVTEERDMLKKAAAYFAKQLG